MPKTWGPRQAADPEKARGNRTWLKLKLAEKDPDMDLAIALVKQEMEAACLSTP